MAREQSHRRVSETQRRRARQSRNKQKSRFKRILAATLMGVLAVLIIAGLAIPSFGTGQTTGLTDFVDRGGFLARPVDGPGVEVEDQGRVHFALLSDRAEPGYYVTYPPTSGTHSPTWERCGVFTQPVPEEIQVHNLEHGFVNILYNSEDPAFVGQLEAAARGLPDWPNYYMFAPYPAMESPVALTAWNRILLLDSVDEDAMREFADAYQARGPEVARGCDSPGVMDQSVPDPTATPDVEAAAADAEPGDGGDATMTAGDATPPPDDSATPDAN